MIDTCQKCSIISMLQNRTQAEYETIPALGLHASSRVDAISRFLRFSLIRHSLVEIELDILRSTIKQYDERAGKPMQDF